MTGGPHLTARRVISLSLLTLALGFVAALLTVAFIEAAGGRLVEHIFSREQIARYLSLIWYPGARILVFCFLGFVIGTAASVSGVVLARHGGGGFFGYCRTLRDSVVRASVGFYLFFMVALFLIPLTMWLTANDQRELEQHIGLYAWWCFFLVISALPARWIVLRCRRD